ncbi:MULTISPECIES: IclR family transcriptional regulator [Pandoraea]|uniref:IclR family transcriptional regulator n=1 Tax=Pandoraea norimbergensis TaxID=93219 RepID=A0ABN4JG21_9BURK|nr:MULTISPECIES: IclR family transcriptional regulator [Pandoraea]ALS59788.1 IclR family transcriptional regulator [Pandoraea norimbergensis]
MTLKTLDNALTLLRHFTAENPTWGVRELAKETGINHSVVQRILATCAQHGFVTQRGKSRKYALGMAFLEFAQSLREGLHLSDLILPIMRRLAANTGETAFLAVLDGKEAVYLEIAESDQNIKYSVAAGTRFALHAGSSGKVIAAYLPEAQLDAILEHGLKRYTSSTITEPAALRADLAAIREQGWSYSANEFADGVFGLALPVFDETDGILASFGVSGPDFRMTDDKRREMLAAVRQELAEVQSLMRRFY